MLQFILIVETIFRYNKGILIFKRGTIYLTITDIKIRKVFDGFGPMRAIASVTLDGQLALHDIKVIYAKDRYFIVMPSKRNPDGTYRDITHPITAGFREEMNTAVLEAYFKALEAIEQPSEPTEN